MEFINLCWEGKLEEAKLMYENAIIPIDIHANNDEAFRMACCWGHLETAQWLYSLGDVDIHTDDEYAFRWACSHKHLETAKWLYSLGGVNIHTRFFCMACCNGYLEIAQWLYSLGETEGVPIDIHFIDDTAFRYACDWGHLETAQWLYSIGANIHACDDDAFRAVCCRGHLDIAQWLYSVGVNIHTDDEYAFRWACRNGHLEIAQWLYSIGGIDIHANNNNVFRYSPKIILEWLNTLEQNPVIGLLRQNKFQEVFDSLSTKQIDDITCRICLDDAPEYPITPCTFNHCYCLQCAYSWYKIHKKECMLCKQEFTWKNISAAKNPVS